MAVPHKAPDESAEAFAAAPSGLLSLFSFGTTRRPAPPAGYVYACDDRSALKPFYYRIFVNPIAAVASSRIRANDVTFVSQFFALIPALIGLYSLHGDAPGWVWGILAPFGYLGYIVLDHLDGTHARKTQTSSPLGELVDHWCDAWNAPLLTFACGLNWGASPLLSSALGFVTGLALCLAYEEHRLTGKMRLDVLGSNEALTGMALSMVAMGILGKNVVTAITLPFGVSLAFTLQMVSLVGSTGAIVMALVRGGPRLFAGIAPYVVGAGAIMAWVGLGLDPRIAPFMMAATSAIVAGRIVLERTTGLKVRVDWVGLALLALGLVLAIVRAPGTLQTAMALAVVLALVARACADFLWGARTLRRFVRRGELLSFVVPGPHSSADDS